MIIQNGFQVAIQLSKEVLSSMLNSWPAVIGYLVGEICYGGQVTDLQDLSCLMALLRKIQCETVRNVTVSDHIVPIYQYIQTMFLDFMFHG